MQALQFRPGEDVVFLHGRTIRVFQQRSRHIYRSTGAFKSLFESENSKPDQNDRQSI